MDSLITIGCEAVKQINFAMQQNYIPVFRSITISNNSSGDLHNLRLKITFEPAFAAGYEVTVDIPAGETVEISPVNIVESLISEYKNWAIATLAEITSRLFFFSKSVNIEADILSKDFVLPVVIAFSKANNREFMSLYDIQCSI